MVLRFFLFAITFFFISCSDIQRDNPKDEHSDNYIPPSSAVMYSSSSKPSSSSVVPWVPSSSSFVIVLPSSSAAKISSSSSESPYKVECKIVNTEFPEGVKIPIDKRPELKCVEKANPSNVIMLHSDNDVGAWENDPPWSSPVAGKYDNIIVTIERDDKGECHRVRAKCEGTVTITSGTKPSSSSSSSITYTLSCANVPTSGTAGVAMSQPTVTCNGTVVPSGVLNWTPNINWSAPVAGYYSNVSVSASYGDCSGKTATCSGTLTVSAVTYGPSVLYEGETYQTVVIGTQTWFKRNLNYAVEGSKCYDNLESNCATYGRLYDWATANTVCPGGWHLPSNADWDKLYSYVDGSTGTSSPYNYDSPTAGRYLKATSGWNDNNGKSGNGQDTYGFSALPGGSGGSRGGFDVFDVVGYRGYWWGSFEYNGYPSGMSMYHFYEGAEYGLFSDKSSLSSVRCLQD